MCVCVYCMCCVCVCNRVCECVCVCIVCVCVVCGEVWGSACLQQRAHLEERKQAIVSAQACPLDRACLPADNARPPASARNQVTRDELEAAAAAVGSFGTDNRAGVAGTLHRISAIRNRRGGVVGLTCRVGRAVTGHVEMIRDILTGGRRRRLEGGPDVVRVGLQGRGCAASQQGGAGGQQQRGGI